MAAVICLTGTGAGKVLGQATQQELHLALRCGLVAGLAFCIDAGVLRLGVTVGLSSAVARCISLFTAMQATFLLNGLLVFRRLELRRCHVQWASYMASSGVGAACNYLIFIGLLAGPTPWLAHRGAAMVIGGVVAWLINYTGSRFIVFGTVPQSRSEPARSPRHVADLARSW